MPAGFGRYGRKPPLRATTGADGFYRLENVPPGSYYLQIVAPAHTPAEGRPAFGIGMGRVINIEAGETIENQDFQLTRGGVITGRVTDADGKPVIAERLKLVHANRESRSVPINMGSPYGFETDDRGVYRIYGLPAGRYLVCAGEEKENGAMRAALSGRNLTHTCYPNATEEAQAKVVEVSPGGEATGVDITLAPSVKTYEATGRIVDAETGQPVANLSYGFGVLGPGGNRMVNRSWSSLKTTPEGEFRFANLMSGRYAVFAATREGDAANYYSEGLPFEIDDANLSGLVLKARRGATLRGVVSVEGTTDRAVLAKLAQVELHVQVVPGNRKAGEFQTGNTSRLIIQPGGGFLVSGLPPGKAQVMLPAFSMPGLRLLRVERGAAEQRDGMEIGDGEQVSDVRIRLVYGTTVVRGQLEVRRDGQPAQMPEGAQMYVMLRLIGGSSGAGRDNISTEVDGRGRFILEGLVAGEYEITGRGWVRPSPATPQGTAFPIVRQTINVPEKGEINVTLIYDLSAKPQGVTP